MFIGSSCALPAAFIIVFQLFFLFIFYMQAAAFGSSCALPGAFRVCVHLLSKELPFEDAVRENIMAGVFVKYFIFY